MLAARRRYADASDRLPAGGHALDALDVSAGPAVAGLLADDGAWATPPGDSVNATARVAAAAAAVESVLASSDVVAVEHPPAALAAFSPAAGVWSTVDEWHARRLRSRWDAAGGLVALLKALGEREMGGNAAAAAAEMRASLVSCSNHYRARVVFRAALAGEHTLLLRAAEEGDGVDCGGNDDGGRRGRWGRREARRGGLARQHRAGGGGRRAPDTRPPAAGRAGHGRGGASPTSPPIADKPVARGDRLVCAPRRAAVLKADVSITAGRLHVLGPDEVGARRLDTLATTSAAAAAVAAAGRLGGLKRFGGEASNKAAEAVTAATHATDAAARAAAAARMPADEAAVKTVGEMAAYARLWRASDCLGAVERLAAEAHAAGVSAGEATAQAGTFVSFTLVTAALTDMAVSWLCSVRALDALPHALVFVAADGESYVRLTGAVAAASGPPPAVGGGAAAAAAAAATAGGGASGVASVLSSTASRLLVAADANRGAAGRKPFVVASTAPPHTSAG